MFRTLRNLGRLIGIARTLARHDALFPFAELGAPALALSLARRLWGPGRAPPERRPGQRLAAALQALGPSFIKLGQALSTRPDLVGPELADDLSELRDRLPPFPGAEARAEVSRELGKPLDELFSSFDEEAVAAASIAQVHFAVTAAGEEVAVKVLRPGIEAAFRRDLELLDWLAEGVERTRPDLRRLRPVDAVRTFAETVDLEMDLRFEAAAASELRDNRGDDESFRVPVVDWQRTSRRVLTLERIAGIPIDHREALQAAGHDLEAIVAKLVGAFLTQAFGDGFFHADLHPGNLFIDEAGNIGAVDFGIMGRLDRKTRRYVAELLLAFLTADYRRAAEVHFEAGYVPPSKSVDAFAQACRSIAEPILGRPVKEVSMGRLLAQLFEVTRTFEMTTQPQLLLLQKTMMVAEGVGRSLAPEVNMWELARPILEHCMRESLGPEARLRDAAEDTAALARRFPALIEKAEQATALLADGGLKLHPDTARQIAAEQARRRRPLYLLLWVTVLLLVLLLALALNRS